LKVRHGEPLSSFAFNLNLRRYKKECQIEKLEIGTRLAMDSIRQYTQLAEV
jgi:hypothetical protein